jgi:hypothetical protein
MKSVYWSTLWHIILAGCIYYTSSWKVAFSCEQMIHIKKPCQLQIELVEKPRSCFQNACVEMYEVVIVINEAWSRSFARVEHNTITVRSWYHLTWNLLNHPRIAISEEGEAQEIPHLDSQSTEASSYNEQSYAGMFNFHNRLANNIRQHEEHRPRSSKLPDPL